MNGRPEDSLPDLRDLVRARTPARLLVGRAGTSYRTATQLDLCEDHAVAVDAVRAEMDLPRDLVDRWAIIEARSRATSKAEYLLRPDLGRRLDAESSRLISLSCPPGVSLQVIIGDGLSPAAVAA